MPGTSGEGRVRSAGPAFAVVAVVSLYVLFWPSPVGSGVRVPGSDKLVHVGLFLLLAGTARLRFGARPAVLTAVVAYAAVSELVQARLTYRSGDVLDVAADVAGALAGWWLLARVPRRP